MPILYKNTDRLLRDAKKVRQSINKETRLAVSAQRALDLIAACFCWDSWNAMHVAGKENSGEHTWWHDLRWRDKARHLNDTVPTALSVFLEKAGWDDSVTHQGVSRLRDVLMGTLMPPADPIIASRKMKGLISRLRGDSTTSYAESVYRELSLSRCREGILVDAPTTLEFTQHLAGNFLPARQDPACLMMCDIISLMDVSRAFKHRGYRVVLINQTYELAKRVGAERMGILPSMDGYSDALGGVSDYLKRYLLSTTLYIDAVASNKASQLMAELVVARASGNGMGLLPIHSLSVPTLQDCAQIILNGEQGNVRSLALAVFTTMFGDPDNNKLEKCAKLLEVPSAMEESWAYMCIPLHAGLSELKELCYGLDDMDRKAASVSRLEREERKVVYLFVVDESRPDSVRHHTALFHLLLSHYSTLPPSTTADMWAIAPVRTFLDIHYKFRFSLHNNARVSVLAYADQLHIVDNHRAEFDTSVVIRDDVQFIDAREA